MRNKASFQLNININAIKTAKTRFPISVFHIWCRLTVVCIWFEELISSHDCDKTWIDKFQLLRLLWHDWCLKLSIKLWPEVILWSFQCIRPFFFTSLRWLWLSVEYLGKISVSNILIGLWKWINHRLFFSLMAKNISIVWTVQKCSS